VSLEGKTISHYEILAQLGEGGMGVVYKARDTKLKRDVALKFLPTELSRDEEANERFVQEAQAASTLNHPNICTVHAIEETPDGKLYIVMPLYEGNTLKYRIDDDSLSEAQAIDIARQIAEGLAAAHKKGIVHRDIKPANVMLTDEGQVIILDFGLAKLTGGLDLTRTGSTVGTAFYMSPEQIRGENVDARADLWSLGVVFYQLLTGKRPFEGQYEQAISYSILNHDPLTDAVLSEADRTILKRLVAKNPDERFSSAEELIVALSKPPGHEKKLERKSFILGKSTFYGIAVLLALVAVVAVLRPWESVPLETGPDLATEQTSEPDRHAIAVLPFTNLRPDSETDFLGYATADQVIGSLSYVKNLNVRPASSIREYDGRSYNAQEAGKELHVDYVVAGNYLRQDDQMRLTVEMVDVQSNEIVWKEPIEVASGDVFVIQDIVSKTVLEKLEVTFSTQELDRMQADVSTHPLAYEYYLRAVSHPRSVTGNELALNLLGQSLALDSTFAPTWSELGFRRHSLGLFGMAGDDMSHSAEAAFDRALALNPELISAIADISTYYTDAGRTDEAYELALRAIEINPNNAMSHFARGYVLRYAGMMEESEDEMRLALDLDSTNIRFRSAGLTLMVNEQFDDARRAYAIDKPSVYYAWSTAASYMRQDRNEDASRVLELAGDVSQAGLPGTRVQSLKSFLSGEYEDVILISQIVEAARLVDGEAHYYNALGFCLSGDQEGCVRNLRRAVEIGYFNYPNLARDPWLDAIRGTPKFEEVLEKARVKHERFKAKYFGNEG
jgi:serine/threonine protein kinase